MLDSLRSNLNLLNEDPLTSILACPHGTFHNPRATFESPRRKSVETRSLIFLPGGNIPKKNELYGLGNSCPLWHIS
jgi:hypothetical protein